MRYPRRTRTFRPSIDGLEPRWVLSTLHSATITAHAAAVSLNSKVVSFAQAHLKQRVGGGECAHLADEALRAAGAQFIATDPNHNGDYVWGKLITTITPGKDSSPNTPCQPGDIIQFQNVKLSSGWNATQHTAIVMAVDSKGRPTKVYEQNVAVNGKYDRTDRLDPMTINATTVKAGTIHIYRPVARVDSPGKVQFSIVNNTTKSVTVSLYFNGQPSGSLPLGVANTAASYECAWVSGPTSAKWSIGIKGTKIALTNASGYEVFVSNGKTSIRAIS